MRTRKVNSSFGGFISFNLNFSVGVINGLHNTVKTNNIGRPIPNSPPIFINSFLFI